MTTVLTAWNSTGKPAQSRRPRREACLEERTGPLEALSGRRVLVLEDEENLRYSARELGYKVSHQKLGGLLRAASRHCSLHAFFSRLAGDCGRADYLRDRGWTAHPRDIQVVRTRRGVRHHANCDNWLLFWAGMLASRCQWEVIVAASGDGALVCDLAAAASQLPIRPRVVTLSLPGSTSFRLDARRNPDIEANIELGLDCLRRIDRVGESHSLEFVGGSGSECLQNGPPSTHENLGVSRM